MRKTILLFLGTLLLLGACQAPAREVTGAEREQVLAYFEPRVESILSAIQAKDFNALLVNFDPTMRTVMGVDNFNQMVAALDARVGKCTDRQVKRVYEQGYMNVEYQLTCEKAPMVSMLIALEPEETHLIGGIFFDAPELH